MTIVLGFVVWLVATLALSLFLRYWFNRPDVRREVEKVAASRDEVGRELRAAFTASWLGRSIHRWRGGKEQHSE